MSATKTSLIAIFVIVVTFIAGVAVGVFGSFVLQRRRPPIPKFASHAMVNRLDRHLDLTDEQREKIAGIIRRRHERINSIWTEIRPRVDAEIRQTNEEIERVLTPEQREKFEKMRLHLGPPHGEYRRHGNRRRRESAR